MGMYESKESGWYGAVTVILTRIVEDSQGRYTDTLIGHKGPYGCVGVREEYRGKKYREEPVGWWEKEGFTVTVDSILPKLMGWKEA